MLKDGDGIHQRGIDMGIFGKKQPKKAQAGSYFKRADGSIVEMSEEEFARNPEFQREVLIVSLMEDVEKGLALLTNPPFSHDALQSAVSRLVTLGMNRGDEQFVATLWRACAVCTRLDDMAAPKAGEFIFNSVAAIYELRMRLLEEGDPASEAALSMVGQTGTAVIETRQDHVAVMRAVQEAAGRVAGG
jgi:hypothetical protein